MGDTTAHSGGCVQSLLAADDPRHGTYNGYSNLKCRCKRCRATNVERTTARRLKIRAAVQEQRRRKAAWAWAQQAYDAVEGLRKYEWVGHLPPDFLDNAEQAIAARYFELLLLPTRTGRGQGGEDG